MTIARDFDVDTDREIPTYTSITNLLSDGWDADQLVTVTEYDGDSMRRQVVTIATLRAGCGLCGSVYHDSAGHGPY